MTMGDNDDIDPKLIKATQDSLGKIIKKPPLTEKLLNRPPFRFLHDVFVSVINSTGFMKGLFTDEEMNPEKVNDKDKKIALLDKVINLVSLVIGEQLSVRATKIVSGRESDKTNELLQALAKAISMKVNNADYVRRALDGDKVGAKKPPASQKKKDDKDSSKADASKPKDSGKGDASKPKDSGKADASKPKDGGKAKEEPKKEASREKPKEAKPDEKDRKERDRSKTRDEKDKRRDEKDSKRPEERGRSRDDRESSKKQDDRKGEESPRDKPPRPREKKAEEPSADDPSKDADGTDERMQRPTSAKGARRKRDQDDVGPGKSESVFNSGGGSARPTTARPGPPRPRTAARTGNRRDDTRAGSGKATRIIVEKESDSDSDDNFVVQESAPQVEETRFADQNDNAEEESEEHGGLVKKILETKKELEAGGTTRKDAQAATKTGIVSDAARKKQRELVQKEVEKLQESVQGLTRSANPLGKMMDYLQEDLDSMQKEYDRWKHENEKLSAELQREQHITDKEIEPLKAFLQELEAQIKEQLDKIAAVKASILQNEEKMSKMLKSIGKQ